MYTNLIVTVTANRMTDYAAWTLLPDASGFESQDINVLEEEE